MVNIRGLTPVARKDELVVQEVCGETLIYDLKSHKAHCLNQTAALVWKYCDGKRTVAQTARKLEAELGMPVSDEVVWLAVEQLGKRKLLQEPVERVPALARMSRREVVRRLGITAAVALPIVTSILAPEAVQAASGCIPVGQFGCLIDSDCCAPARCNVITGQCFNP